jgi:hypothetical protein
MLRAFKIALVALLFLCSAVCFAQDGKADEQLVKKLMQESGLGKQIEQFPAMMQADIIKSNQESGNKMSQGELNDLLRMAAEAFNAATMKDTVRRHIQENLPEKDMGAVLKWFGSPLGKKILKLEEEASSPEANKKIQEMSGEIYKNPERATLLSRLDKAVKATDVGVSITTNLQVAFILAVTAGMPAEQRPSVDEILSEINKDREQLQKTIRQETIAGFFYTYRSLKDAEIKKYITFAESGPGKRYHTVSSEGLNTAMMQAGLALGSKLSTDLSKEGKGSF